MSSKLTEQFFVKARDAKNVDELLKIAKEESIELSLKNAQNILCMMKGETALSDEDLADVSGGNFLEIPRITCPKCGHNYKMLSNTCPVCNFNPWIL